MHFSCAEANVASGSSNLPLLVVAVNEQLLGNQPWSEYAKAYCRPPEHPAERQGHFNPAIHKAAAQVVVFVMPASHQARSMGVRLLQPFGTA